MFHHALRMMLITLAVGAASPAAEVTFTKTTIDPIFRSEGVAIGDFNKDGKKDICVGDYWYEAPDWKRHELRPPKKKIDNRSGYTEAFGVYADDFNKDGHADLAIGTQNGIKLFQGKGCTGAETTWWRPLSIAHSRATMQVCTGDINQDGKPDIVSSSASGILVLFNNGAGRFTKQSLTGLPLKGEYSGCCLFDWDNDGDLDIACSSFQGLGIHFYENRLKNRP